VGRTVAETVVDYLRAQGVRHVFGVIGSALLDIMDVLYHTREIQYIATQHEQGAAFAAGGYASIVMRGLGGYIWPPRGRVGRIPGHLEWSSCEH